jgi:TFIIF-interacting CTD phosphatase-like protein
MMTTVCEIMLPSNDQCKSLEKLPEPEERQFNLVLDLDQTLIHTIRTTDYDVVRFHCTSKNLLIHFVHESTDPTKNDTHFLVFYRPGVFKFLEKMAQLFTIYIYTNAVSSYADKIISTIHQSLGEVIKKYYYRKQNSSYLQKHLKNITFFTDDTIIIDDRLDVWMEDVTNVIRIIEFLGPDGPSPYLEDMELYYLIPIITEMREIAISKRVSLASLISYAYDKYIMAHVEEILLDEDDYFPTIREPEAVDFLKLGVISSSFE